MEKVDLLIIAGVALLVILAFLYRYQLGGVKQCKLPSFVWIAVGWLMFVAAITILGVWPHAFRTGEAFTGLVILSALLIVVGQSKTGLPLWAKCILIIVQLAAAFVLIVLSVFIIGCLDVKC